MNKMDRMDKKFVITVFFAFIAKNLTDTYVKTLGFHHCLRIRVVVCLRAERQ